MEATLNDKLLPGTRAPRLQAGIAISRAALETYISNGCRNPDDPDRAVGDIIKRAEEAVGSPVLEGGVDDDYTSLIDAIMDLVRPAVEGLCDPSMIRYILVGESTATCSQARSCLEALDARDLPQGTPGEGVGEIDVDVIYLDDDAIKGEVRGLIELIEGGAPITYGLVPYLVNTVLSSLKGRGYAVSEDRVRKLVKEVIREYMYEKGGSS